MRDAGEHERHMQPQVELGCLRPPGGAGGISKAEVKCGWHELRAMTGAAVMGCLELPRASRSIHEPRKLEIVGHGWRSMPCS